MKIEKINDNQIRCTLTREDLESHPYQRTCLWNRQSQKAFSGHDAAGTDSIRI